MRSLDELVDGKEDAWPALRQQASQASGSVEILPCDAEAGQRTLMAAQVTTRSPMGAIAFHSGGLLVDHGWLRILGAGHPRIGGGLIEWNAGLGGRPLEPALEAAMLVAYDAVGGFFAINAGRWDGEPGAIHYLAPILHDGAQVRRKDIAGKRPG